MPPRGYKKNPNPFCDIEGCNNPPRYKGLCGKHYKRNWRHGDPNISKIIMDYDGAKCCVENCENFAHIRNMCKLHYTRFLKYGRTFNIIAERGSGTTTTAGYRLITVDGKRVYEHIWIAEQALGRPLPPKAIVHHVNGNANDNRHTNLVICPNQEYHLLLHRREEAIKQRGECDGTGS